MMCMGLLRVECDEVIGVFGGGEEVEGKMYVCENDSDS